MYNSLYDIFRNERKNYYEVKKNDSLYKIAKANNIDVSDLMKANNLVNTMIYPNQILIIPTKKDVNGIYFEEYITLNNESIKTILDKFNLSLDDLVKYNKLENLELIEGQVLMLNIKSADEKFLELKKNNVDFEKLVYENKDKWLI